MVVIRLSPRGAKHRLKYRITVADQRRANSGRFIEVAGYYNPLARGQEVTLKLDKKRIDYWVGKGAQMTKRVRNLIKKS